MRRFNALGAVAVLALLAPWTVLSCARIVPPETPPPVEVVVVRPEYEQAIRDAESDFRLISNSKPNAHAYMAAHIRSPREYLNHFASVFHGLKANTAERGAFVARVLPLLIACVDSINRLAVTADFVRHYAAEDTRIALETLCIRQLARQAAAPECDALLAEIKRSLGASSAERIQSASETAWIRAASSAGPGELMSLAKRRPELSERARNEFDAAHMENLLAGGSPSALGRYLATFPHSPVGSAVQNRLIEARAADLGARPVQRDVDAFLAEFSESDHPDVEKVRALRTELLMEADRFTAAVNDGSESALQEFATRYPESRFAGEARSLLEGRRLAAFAERFANPMAGGSPLPTEDLAALGLAATIRVDCENSLGSGFFVTDFGLIATNHHVVDDCRTIQVWYGGRWNQADLLFEDSQRDLALLSIAQPTPFLELAPDDSAVAGQEIMAVGHPGLGGSNSVLSVTKGVVSNPSKWFGGTRGVVIDAAINSGNSGGPVLDMRGRVVGVAMETISDYDGRAKDTETGKPARVLGLDEDGEMTTVAIHGRMEATAFCAPVAELRAFLLECVPRE